MDIFIFLLCLIAPAKTPSTMLIRCGESQCLCFVPSIRGKACSVMLVIGSLFIFFIRWRKFPSIPSFLIVFKIRNRCCNYFLAFWLRSSVAKNRYGIFSSGCSAYIEMIICVTVVDLLIW